MPPRSRASRRPGAHAAGGAHVAGPEVPEPTFAERAKTLVAQSRVGALATNSQKAVGFPFASVMPYSLDREGRPVFLISAMAVHSKNVLADGRSSLLVTAAEASQDPLGAGRVTLIGTVARIHEPEEPMRRAYLERHPSARHWIDYSDFFFARLDVSDSYFVGGFGVMGWIEAADYTAASPDPLAEAAPALLLRLHAEGADCLAAIACRRYGPEVSQPKITAVDRLGFHLRVQASGRVRGCRIAFPAEVRTPEAAWAAVRALADRPS